MGELDAEILRRISSSRLKTTMIRFAKFFSFKRINAYLAFKSFFISSAFNWIHILQEPTLRTSQKIICFPGSETT